MIGHFDIGVAKIFAACAQSRIFIGSVPISSEGKKALSCIVGFQ